MNWEILSHTGSFRNQRNSLISSCKMKNETGNRLKEDYQILGYELYEYPKSPEDKGRYHGKTPILEQAETAVRTAKESGITLLSKQYAATEKSGICK